MDSNFHYRPSMSKKTFALSKVKFLQVTETGRRMKALLDAECIPAITQRSECLADWYKMAQTVYLQTQILDKDMINYERSLDTYSYRLSRESSERHEVLLRFVERLPERPAGNQTSTLSGCIQDEGTKKWQSICETQKEIARIISENNILVQQLDRLSLLDSEFSDSDHDNEPDNEDYQL